MRRWCALVAALGALPTLVWAALGCGLIYDDWRYAATVHFDGVFHLLREAATQDPGRPGQAAYFAFSYAAFGTHPLPHALLLAALNAAAAVLVFVVADRIWGRQMAIFVTLAWLALANRGSTHFWFATAPSVLSLCLLLAVVLALLDERWVLASVALSAAVLTYESVLGLGVAAFAVWAWRSPRGSIPRAAIALVPVGGAALFIVSHSSKDPGALHPGSMLSSLLNAEFGAGVFGVPLAAALGGGLLLVAVTAAFYRWLSPSWSPTEAEMRVLHGAGILIAGAAPFLAVGFHFAGTGVFDRGNLTPDLGLAVMMAAVATLAVEHLDRIGIALAVISVGWLAFLGTRDLRNYTYAVRDGTRLRAHLAVDVPTINGRLMIGPPQRDYEGIEQFYTSDIGNMLRLARNDPTIVANMACSRTEFRKTSDPLRYNRITRRLDQRRTQPAGAPGYREQCD